VICQDPSEWPVVTSARRTHIKTSRCDLTHVLNARLLQVRARVRVWGQRARAWGVCVRLRSADDGVMCTPTHTCAVVCMG
jgi:hypothetical protein